MSFDLETSLHAAATRQNAEGCVKLREDLDRYRSVLARMRPDLIIECGTFSGKSAVWFANECANLGIHTKVVTIDIDPKIDPGTRLAFESFGIEDFHASSVDNDVLDYVCNELAGTSDSVLLVLDSDHSGPHVINELNGWAFVADYIVVEDTILRWMPESERRWYRGDPLEAVELWLPEHPEWAIDVEVDEMHEVSCYPYGWWKKAR